MKYTVLLVLPGMDFDHPDLSLSGKGESTNLLFLWKQSQDEMSVFFSYNITAGREYLQLSMGYEPEYLIGELFFLLFIYIPNNLALIMSWDFYIKITTF